MFAPSTPTRTAALRRAAAAALVALATVAAAAPAAGAAPVAAPAGSVPRSSEPAPSLPPMPPMPALPELVPLSVRAGELRAATTTTTSPSPAELDPSELTAPSTLPERAGTDTDAGTDAASPGADVAELPVAQVTERFSAGLAEMGLPGFAADGTLDVAPLGGPSSGDLAERYASLGGTLVAFYAQRAGTSLPAFVEENSSSLGSVLGTTPRPSSAATLDALSADLRSAGVVGNSRRDFGAAFASSAAGVDAQVARAGLGWAADMARFRSTSATLGPESLAFANMLSSSLSGMVGEFPDLFAQARNSAVGSPAAASAWRSSMMDAAVTTGRSLASMSPSPCLNTMMSAMATGSATASPTAGGCGGCAATGLYLNRQMASLFDPARSSTQANRSDSLLPPTEWHELPDWQRNIIAAQNPSLAAAPAEASAPGCAAVRAAAPSAMGATLPDVFANLRPNR